MMDSKANAIHGLKLNVVQITQQPERTFTQIFFIPRSTADLVHKPGGDDSSHSLTKSSTNIFSLDLVLYNLYRPK
jgi:hypothetical protein